MGAFVICLLKIEAVKRSGKYFAPSAFRALSLNYCRKFRCFCHGGLNKKFRTGYQTDQVLT